MTTPDMVMWAMLTALAGSLLSMSLWQGRARRVRFFTMCALLTLSALLLATAVVTWQPNGGRAWP